MVLKSPTYNKLLEICTEPFLAVQTALEYLRDNTGVSTAAGIWLDRIGKIVGLDRPYREQSYSTIFAFKDAETDIDDPYKGFVSGGIGGYFQTTKGLKYIADPTEKISDAAYRLRILGKAVANFAGGTITDIFKFLTTGYGLSSPTIASTPGSVNVEIEDSEIMTQGDRWIAENKGPVAAGVGFNVDNWTFEYLHFTPATPASWTIPAGTVSVDGKDCKYIYGVADYATLATPSYFGITSSEAAYGEWGFWNDKSGAGAPIFMMIATVNDTPLGATQDGYALRIDASEAVELIRVDNGAVTSLFKTSTGYVSPVLYNKYVIVRDSTDDSFAVYVNDVLAPAASGTNPVIDSTYQTSAYMSMYAPTSLDLWPLVAIDDDTKFMWYTPE